MVGRQFRIIPTCVKAIRVANAHDLTKLSLSVQFQTLSSAVRTLELSWFFLLRFLEFFKNFLCHSFLKITLENFTSKVLLFNGTFYRPMETVSQLQMASSRVRTGRHEFGLIYLKTDEVLV